MTPSDLKLDDGRSEMSDSVFDRIEADLLEIQRRVHEYENALRFYARHEHWMAATEDADALRRSFVAMAGDGEQHGWHIAEHILTKHDGLKAGRAPQ